MGLTEKINELRDKCTEKYIKEMAFEEEHHEYVRKIYETGFNEGVLALLEARGELKT